MVTEFPTPMASDTAISISGGVARPRNARVAGWQAVALAACRVAQRNPAVGAWKGSPLGGPEAVAGGHCQTFYGIELEHSHPNE